MQEASRQPAVARASGTCGDAPRLRGPNHPGAHPEPHSEHLPTRLRTPKAAGRCSTPRKPTHSVQERALRGTPSGPPSKCPRPPPRSPGHFVRPGRDGPPADGPKDAAVRRLQDLGAGGGRGVGAPGQGHHGGCPKGLPRGHGDCHGTRWRCEGASAVGGRSSAGVGPRRDGGEGSGSGGAPGGHPGHAAMRVSQLRTLSNRKLWEPRRAPRAPSAALSAPKREWCQGTRRIPSGSFEREPRPLSVPLEVLQEVLPLALPPEPAAL